MNTTVTGIPDSLVQEVIAHERILLVMQRSSPAAQALLDSGAFSDALDTVDQDTAAALYGIDADTITGSAVYTSLSAGAEEIAVLVLTDEDAAAAAESACQAHVESRIESSAQYCPDQVPKLEDAVISRLGNTVLLAVGETEALNTAIESLT